MDERFQPLAELAVHGANVQPGQIVAVGATIGQHDLARAVAGAAYRRGALFVDVVYFDPYVKRERIANADPESLGYVPPWYGARLQTLGDRDDARIGLAGIVHPDAFTGLDPNLVGRDQLPWLKETSRLVAEKSTNWSIIPCPHRVWASLVYPELGEDAAFERLWDDLWHVLRLGELALVDRNGRIGPLGTVFYDTLLDENAASHIALGFGFPFSVEDSDRDRINKSEIHVDSMIGSPELEVTGVTAAGDRVPVMRQGEWQL